VEPFGYDVVAARSAYEQQGWFHAPGGATPQLMEAVTEQVGRLVAGVAHEVTTPLRTLGSSLDTLRRVISGYLELATSESARGNEQAARLERSAASVDKLLDVIATSRRRLASLVGSLKRFVSLDQATRQRLDVRESIDTALSVLGADLTPDITVKQSYAEPDLFISGDPAKVNQLFWNLLQNALTALGGKGEICIDARRVNGSVQVDLSDNGVGIPGDRLKEVFDFGFTQNNGRIGLRLGLPTSKWPVDVLGGEIRIDSAPGKGTAVHLSRPA
jgi:signal transduction histidine kinase